MKLVHLVGFIVKKFVTMHGHMNVNSNILSANYKLYAFSKIPHSVKIK